jgi:CBS domain-containing protein
VKLRHVLETKSRKDVVTIGPHEPMRAVVDTLVRNNIGALVVVAEGQPVGIVTERDVLRQVAVAGAAFLDKPVAEVMTQDIVIGTLDREVEEANYTMTDRRFRHLPIMDQGKLVGIVSMGDIVRAQCVVAETEVHYMRDYIAGGYH